MKRHDLHWNAWMGVTNERKGMNRWKDEMKWNDMKRNEMKWTTRTQTFEALKLFNESLYFRFQLYSDAEQDMDQKEGSHSFSFYVVDSWQINSGGSGRKCRQIQVPQALESLFERRWQQANDSYRGTVGRPFDIWHRLHHAHKNCRTKHHSVCMHLSMAHYSNFSDKDRPIPDVWMATYFLIVIVVSTFTLAEQKHAAIPIRSPCRHAAHSWKKAHACSFYLVANKHKEIAAPFKPTQVVLSATTHPSRILSLHGFTHISVATPTAHHTIFCTASKLNPVFNQTKMTFMHFQKYRDILRHWTDTTRSAYNHSELQSVRPTHSKQSGHVASEHWTTWTLGHSEHWNRDIPDSRNIQDTHIYIYITKASCQAWLKLLIANEVRIGVWGQRAETSQFEAVHQPFGVATAVGFAAKYQVAIGWRWVRFPPGPCMDVHWGVKTEEKQWKN